ncbi:hypothetical protein D6833_02110 [Candidatus Parcubacteria bacterium]|nr:MAG: hypothetical protein D6833_02110 [Candidatus Parcubacteria bacterium]
MASCIDQNVATPAIDLTPVEAVQDDGTQARVKDAMGNLIASDLTTVAAVKASEVLTVWRRVHVEVDSMGPEPAWPDAEANVVRGEVVRVEGDGTKATRVVVDQNLDDGSPLLPQGNGRFEWGTITIGSGSQAATTTFLGNNGVDFVQKTFGEGIEIPFVISKGGVRGSVSGQVWALEPSLRRFSVTVDQGSLSSLYNGGEINVAGVAMVIQSIDRVAQTVQVVQLVDIPFELMDDDEAAHPFDVNLSLLQDSDDLNDNRLATAYVRPVYDLNSPTEAPFNRNVNVGMLPDPDQEAKTQLMAGRDSMSTNDFWTVYFQGAFQEDSRRDQDPNSETQLIAGWTPDFDFRGSLIFVEAIRDGAVSVGGGQTLADQINMTTVVHELGHQFGLGENTGGVMNQGVFDPDQAFFTDDHLHLIRSRLKP